MKKTWTRLLIAVLVLAMVSVVFVACGDNANENKSENNGGNSGSSSYETALKNDEQILKDKGYTTSDYTSSAFIGVYASELGTNADDLVAVLSATNYDRLVTVIVYYFKTESAAKTCYDANLKDSESHHLSGSKIVYGDFGADLNNY